MGTRSSARRRSSSNTSPARDWCRRWRPASGTVFATSISNAVQAIVFDTIEERFDERAVAQARGRLDMAYGMLEAQLGQSEFLAGDAFTIADCAAAPGLFFALAIHAWDESAHPQLTRYYRALARRPSVAKVIDDARPYRHLFPLPWPVDFDRYHLQGRGAL